MFAHDYSRFADVVVRQRLSGGECRVLQQDVFQQLYALLGAEQRGEGGRYTFVAATDACRSSYRLPASVGLPSIQYGCAGCSQADGGEYV